MADRNEKVYERVRQELTKNPKLGSRELYGIAQDVDKSMGKDTLQQFHARYVLPVKREQSVAKGGARGAKRGRKARKAVAQPKATKAAAPARRGRRAQQAATGSERDRVRSVFLEFARDFADAESRAEIVQVLSRVEDYVDRIAPNSA